MLHEPLAKVEEHSQKRARGGAKKGERRGGRRKGTLNKTTGELKDMILEALSDEGGVEYLRKVAKEDIKAFCSLIGRVLPLTLNGDPANPIHMKITAIELCALVSSDESPD